MMPYSETALATRSALAVLDCARMCPQGTTSPGFSRGELRHMAEDL